MDLSRAVDEFVALGRGLYRRLQAEGETLSKIDLHILGAQLHVLQTETGRLKNQHPQSVIAPQSELPYLPAASHHHSLELYKDHAFLVETAIAFIRVGLEMQDTVVVLATQKHRKAIEGSLAPMILKHKTLFFLDAEDLLSRFMINDWPDESRFMDTMSVGLMLSDSARVRIFQEMTALLWTQATQHAAIHVEKLFNKLVAKKPINLLCAYQRAHFSGKEGHQFQDKMCDLHRYLNVQTKRS
jgi:hypothetical protein